MAKLKATPFIIIGGILHLCALIAVETPIMNCEARPECISPASKILVQILMFPMNLISILLHLGGPATSLTFVAIIFNSFVAMTIVWFVFVRPFLWLAKRKDYNE
jgi:hypothetical protein